MIIEPDNGRFGVSGRHSFYHICVSAVRGKEVMNRREIREQIFKMLFQTEFYEKEELDEQIQISMEELTEKDEGKRTYIEQKLREIYRHQDEIDAWINEKAIGWKTSRMAKVDLALIRLAVYEIKYETEIPSGVAINEAVELAKVYSSDGAPSFVNGVLAKFV